MSPRGRTRNSTVSAMRRAESGASRPDLVAAQSAGTGLLRRVWTWVHDGPLLHSYYALAASAVLLSAVGVMMVLSSSSVESISSDQSAYQYFWRQLVFGGGGIFAMVVLSLLPPKLFERCAVMAFAVTSLGLATVLLWGTEINGNRNWIQIGQFTAQPSEAAKLGVALMLGWYFAKYSRQLHGWGYLWPSGLILLVPLIGVGAGGDAGTAIIFVLIYAAALFLAGAPLKLFAVGGLGALVISAFTVVMAPHRMDRVTGWITGNCDAAGSCWQAQQGLGALATGGWWGVGLGQSRSKYSYVPEAHNDYIFAIIGEELGLIGTVFILALFAVMAVAMARVLLRSNSTFERITTGGILAWLIGQAFVNIGMVTGALPVIGVPLPFISYGGSSLFMCLAAVGVVMSFTRLAGPTWLDRLINRFRGPSARTTPSPAPEAAWDGETELPHNVHRIGTRPERTS
ncbi:putative lipid II flippase FtsW [Kocuria sp.]|uniref:putative lipid II flippase FtsW n=1 Tax=Kocuria sp. TaxID=1871328 RepID=UPI0026E08CE8|nr:putative lipid II flippase FtsW [Kocuria sp.]MDO5618452.1 putative lipid II flippase FtsW [Kocuria sp.]